MTLSNYNLVKDKHKSFQIENLDGYSLRLELDKGLVDRNILNRIEYDLSRNLIIFQFGEKKYNDKKIVVSTKLAQQDWNKFIDTTRKKLDLQDIDKEDIVSILDSLDNNYKIICDLNNISHDDYNQKETAIQEPFTKSDNIQEISFEEWQNTLKEKYENLHNKANELIPEIWDPLEFALSIKSILNIKDCSLPFIGILLGPPSSVKTLTLELFREADHTFYTDNFSAKSFVSHNTSVARDKLQEIDLLPKIKDKLFLTPELSPTFSKRDDELTEILGIMTRIADGHGYESDSGAQGHRGYSGEYMFTWIGAAVDIPRKVHKLLGTLGPKIYFKRLYNKKNVDEERYLEKLKNSDTFKDNFNEIKISLDDYILWFNRYLVVVDVDNNDGHSPNNTHPSNVDTPIKIEWNTNKDSDEALIFIIRLAKLLSHLRGVIPTWETKDTQGSDYAYAFATREEPNRAMVQLKNLARGHALSQGRNYITIDDIPLIIQVVLSTASKERVIIFDYLLENNGQITTTEVKESCNTTSPTALKTMTEFTALELVDMISLGDDYNALKQIKLKSEFGWFLTKEFKKLRSLSEDKIDRNAQHEQLNKHKLDKYCDDDDGNTLRGLSFSDERHKENLPPSTTENNFETLTLDEKTKDIFSIIPYNKNQHAIELYKK